MIHSGKKKRCVIDTNVPIVANGRLDNPDKPVSLGCRENAIKFLQHVREAGIVLLDREGAIRQEYRKSLRPSGQPGVGDRFYRGILDRRNIEEIDLLVKDGVYQDLPQEIVDARFDEDDRKFAALAKKAKVPVVNAVDKGWLDHIELLRKHGIRVCFVCGKDRENWFEKG